MFFFSSFLFNNLLFLLLLVKVNIMQTFNSSEYDRPFLFAHRYKTGGSNFMNILNGFCGEYNLKCASCYSSNDGSEDETLKNLKNIHVLNHSRANEYDIIGGHYVRFDFAKRFLGIILSLLFLLLLTL